VRKLCVATVIQNEHQAIVIYTHGGRVYM
jgi:hypothetical protein